MRSALALLFLVLVSGCQQPERPEAPAEPTPPSILLVTLDTTRADAIGADTPSFNALAARGRRFAQAYATTPQTLPSHSSMMTGLYPGGHGVHENARHLAESHPLIAEHLGERGYETAAFVSAFPLARRFGLARGFEVYDDELPAGSSERKAEPTTERAISWLSRPRNEPVFLWVHYFDPHYPYESPNGYRGEVAAMDAQLGRLVEAFETRMNDPVAIVVAGDHGEGLGDHGEAQHGNLVYQSTMQVPLVVIGPGVRPGISDTPVSIRRIFHTLATWSGSPSELSLTGDWQEIVLGEAMKPFLQYGWRPQVMAVDGMQKVIHAGRIEVYDVASDPAETKDLAPTADLSREMRKALLEYPIPAPGAPGEAPLTDEDRKRLASLGYVSSSARPPIRENAPRPVDMAHLFEALDRASGLFVAEEYAAVIPLLERILSHDKFNLAAALQLAVAHSALGHEQQATVAFRRAQTIAPDSLDVQHYLALHYVKGRDWKRAGPILEDVLAAWPDRLPALEALATVREREERLEDALRLRQKAALLKAASGADLVRIGDLAMELGKTNVAIEAFEKARAVEGDRFHRHLELGVLYLVARRLEDARAELERVTPSDPGYPMALFKRAQVSALLGEADRASWIEAAREHADETTRDLIANERLFREEEVERR